MGQATQKHKTKLPNELADYLAPVLLRYPPLINRVDFNRVFAKYCHPKNEIEWKEARDQLVCGNILLVVSIAKRYFDRGVPPIDLLQEGAIGLMTALQHFDPSLGFCFGTYATWWIRQAIDRAVQDTSQKVPFRLPVHLREKIRAIAQAALLFFEQRNFWPNDRELWQALRRLKTKAAREMTLKEVARCRPIILYRYHSLGAASRDDGRPFAEVMADPRADVAREADISLMRERCLEALKEGKHFSPRDITVVSRRLNLDNRRPATLKELAEQLNLSRERIRQIQIKATRRLSAKLRPHLLQEGGN